MRRVIFKLAVAMLAFTAGVAAFIAWGSFRLLPSKVNNSLNGSPRSTRLSLYLSATNTSFGVGEAPEVHAALTNNDSETVTLVHPGDGSEEGWRTPIISWAVINADENVPVPEDKRSRCGNQNALQSDEVFRLGPGETEQLKWVYLPPFTKQGTYRVVLRYENNPSAEWKGLVMGTHNPVAMWRVRHSTEAVAASNEVTFTVTK